MLVISVLNFNLPVLNYLATENSHYLITGTHFDYNAVTIISTYTTQAVSHRVHR